MVQLCGTVFDVRRVLLLGTFVGALLLAGMPDFKSVSSAPSPSFAAAAPQPTDTFRKDEAKVVQSQKVEREVPHNDHHTVAPHTDMTRMSVSAEEVFEFPSWWTEAEKHIRGAYLEQVLRRAVAAQRKVNSPGTFQGTRSSYLTEERLAPRTISSTRIHWNSPSSSSNFSNLARTSEDANETRIAFLCCVRGWLFDFLWDRATHAPSAARWRMGEVRTWTALLESLLSLGSEVVLSRDCAELATWEHSAPSVMSSSGGVLRVHLTEDLSLHFLRALPISDRCRRFKATIAVAGERSKFFPMSRVLPLFHVVHHSRSLGLIAHCNDAPPVFKAWFALLWGKSKQTALTTRLLQKSAAALVPVISSCVSQCDPQLPTLRLRASNRTTAVFDLLLRHAALLLGPAAPNVGATCAEALACGTHVVARGRSLGFEFAGHPLAHRFRKPAEFHAAVNATLQNLGFAAARRFDQQPGPPRPLARQHLPERYGTAGHRAHIAQLFGVDATSTRGVIDPTSLAVTWHAGSPTLRSGGQAHGGAALLAAFTSHEGWEGC